jgi:hypothetical protein
MNCELCGREVHGDILVRNGELPDGTWVVALVSTPDRDWIACDSCNATVCHQCCQYPESGYCNACIKEHNLYAYLVETGLIQQQRTLKSADADLLHAADGDLERRRIDETIEQQARQTRDVLNAGSNLKPQQREESHDQGTITEKERKG